MLHGRISANFLTRMKIDFRDGQAGLFAIQRYISDKLLEPDEVAYSQHSNAMAGYQDTGKGSFLGWLGDDNRMIEASIVNRQFHDDVPILQACENVETCLRRSP